MPPHAPLASGCSGGLRLPLAGCREGRTVRAPCGCPGGQGGRGVSGEGLCGPGISEQFAGNAHHAEGGRGRQHGPPAPAGTAAAPAGNGQAGSTGICRPCAAKRTQRPFRPEPLYAEPDSRQEYAATRNTPNGDGARRTVGTGHGGLQRGLLPGRPDGGRGTGTADGQSASELELGSVWDYGTGRTISFEQFCKRHELVALHGPAACLGPGLRRDVAPNLALGQGGH